MSKATTALRILPFLAAIGTTLPTPAQEAATALTTPALGFEEMASWIGVTVDRDDVKEGSQAALWADTVETTRVRLRAARIDASAYDKVTFWAHSATTTGATLAFVLVSDNPATDGDDDNLRYNFRVDWTGWKQIEISKSDFKPIREPIGFSKIDAIVFASSGYNCGDPVPGTVIKLDDIRFSSANAPAPAAASPGVGGASPPGDTDAAGAVAPAGAGGGIAWTAFDGAALSKTIEVEGVALIYFRSDIAMCKDFERAYLLTPEANRLLSGKTLYFADPSRSELIARQFRVFKVPTLVLVHPNQQQELLSIDAETKPGDIAAFLSKAVRK